MLQIVNILNDFYFKCKSEFILTCFKSYLLFLSKGISNDLKNSTEANPVIFFGFLWCFVYCLSPVYMQQKKY